VAGPDLTDRTVDEPSQDAAESSPSQVFALTILDHPDAARIGETAILAALSEGGSAELSRLMPVFTDNDGQSGRPLSVPFLSRTPIRLEHRRGAVRIVVPEAIGLVLDGERVRFEGTVAADMLREGVVLELFCPPGLRRRRPPELRRRPPGRIVLLLHLAARRHPGKHASLGLVGESDAIVMLRDEILRVATLDIPILLLGPSGSGKDMVARAIHANSRRAGAPCVCVNMAAVPPSTAASELFGHVAGAFTGASREHVGHFAQAHGGTLFLDEIADMPLELQSMLLRVLESHEVQPLGSQRTRNVDIRLVAATDADLEQAIASGKFREPLFHRLAGYQIHVPPLRQRRDDVGRLISHFSAQYLAEAEPGSQARLPPRLVALLARYAWPGNVRQLQNVVRQLLIALRDPPSPIIYKIAAQLLRRDGAAPHPPEAAASSAPVEVSEDELAAALGKNAWCIARTAGYLGISRTTLYALIDRSSRIRKARDVPAEELVRCLEECGRNLDAASARLQVSKRGLRLRLQELHLL